MKKICVLLTICFAVMVSAQTKRSGTIVLIKGTEIQVKNENVNAPFLAGEHLRLLTGDQNVAFEVTFPMQTVSKCKLISGNISKLRIGMVVVVEPQNTRSDDGNKVGKENDENFSLSTTVFVLKDAKVPDGGINFPTGISDDKIAQIKRGFLIAESETTWEQWAVVKKWAESHGYSFESKGGNGMIGDRKEYDIRGQTKKKTFSESDSGQYPVTFVNWRDAIVWCNALTEYYNNTQKKSFLDCVYYIDASYSTPLRASTSLTEITESVKGSQDCPYIKASTDGNTDMTNCIAKGFRLPTGNEWEYAARFRGNDPTNTVLGFKNPYFTKGDSASGSVGSGDKDKDSACSVAVFAKYDELYTGVTATAKVKSKIANALGIYDMSGNVWEWCFDSSSMVREIRGGSFWDNMYDMSLYSGTSAGPNTVGYVGIRFVRTK